MPNEEVFVVLKKSSDGGMLYLQKEGDSKANWIHLTEQTKKYAQRLTPSAKINATLEKKEDKTFVRFFKFVDAPASGAKKFYPGKTSTSYGARPATTGGGSWGKDPETQDSIVKQTVLKGASELVSSLTFPTIEEALDAWDTAFEHMYERVKTKAKTDDGLVEVSTPDDDPTV